MLNKRAGLKRIDMPMPSYMRVVYRHFILIIASIFFIFPLYWLLSTSLKSDLQIMKVPPVWIPHPFMWKNYLDMWTFFPFFLFLKNTLVIVILSMAGVLVTSPLVGYSFARLKWPGRDFFFLVVLGTLMLPSQVTMIPLYLLFNKLGWVNTSLPLWVPAWFGGGAFYIFLVRQFLLSIPKDIEESAFIDGAGYWRIYTHIMIPLIQPVLTTIAIFQFMGAWNDFIGPLIYLSDQTKFTLSLGLRIFQQQTTQAQGEIGMMMAATTVMVIPVILFFFLAQKKFIEGVVLTGLKA